MYVLAESTVSTLEIIDITLKSSGVGGIMTWSVTNPKSRTSDFGYLQNESIFYIAGLVNSNKQVAFDPVA